MTLLIGIVIGIAVSILVLIITLYSKSKLERAFNQTQSLLKEKGKIIEPEDEELSGWIDNLKEK